MVMIATVMLQDDGPVLRIPLRALDERSLHAGQRVRVEVTPLGPVPRPLIESDGHAP